MTVVSANGEPAEATGRGGGHQDAREPRAARPARAILARPKPAAVASATDDWMHSPAVVQSSLLWRPGARVLAKNVPATGNQKWQRCVRERPSRALFRPLSGATVTDSSCGATAVATVVVVVGVVL
jgi:hypothetical protein